MRAKVKAQVKAQIQVQVFVYILAAFIAGLIMVFGVQQIFILIEVKCKQDQKDFGEQMTQFISTMKYDDIRTQRVVVLGCHNYNATCFIDLSKFNSIPSGFDKNYPLIESSWKIKAKKNLFLYPDGKTSFYIGEITIDSPDHYICFPIVAGAVEFKLKGLGTSVLVSSP